MRLQLMNRFHTEIKYGGCIHTQIALDFKLNLEVILRNDIFQTNSLLHPPPP